MFHVTLICPCLLYFLSEFDSLAARTPLSIAPVMLAFFRTMLSIVDNPAVVNFFTCGSPYDSSNSCTSCSLLGGERLVDGKFVFQFVIFFVKPGFIVVVTFCCFVLIWAET